jgi:hypothetical protein
MRSLSPTRTQKVFPLSASVIVTVPAAGARPWQDDGFPAVADPDP